MAVMYLVKMNCLLPSKPTLKDGLHRQHRCDRMCMREDIYHNAVSQSKEMEQPGCPSVGQQMQQMNVNGKQYNSQKERN